LLKSNDSGYLDQKSFQVGSNTGTGHLLTISGITLSLSAIAHAISGSNFWASSASAAAINTTISNTVDKWLTKTLETRALIGAYQNRLEYTMKQLDTTSENLSSSESRIRDADMAKEMMRFTASNVLQQAGISMLAQANMAPQAVLQLLR